MKLKDIKVKPTIMVDKHHIDFELLPTFGFVKKPLGWCVESSEPIGYTYGIAIGWLIFGITLSYTKK